MIFISSSVGFSAVHIAHCITWDTKIQDGLCSALVYPTGLDVWPWIKLWEPCDFNNSAAFPPAPIQETHTFSFSFQFHILGRVSPPNIPSWKADSTVHLNPWNSSTCFSDLHLTCNIPSSGISDSCNRETKTSQKYTQPDHSAIKRAKDTHH